MGILEMSDGEESLDKASIHDVSDGEYGDEPALEHETEEVVDESDASDSDEDYSDEEDEIDEAEAEAAYMRQLEDEAFESEIRKLTLDAIEKGKVSAKTGAGNKVSAQMPCRLAEQRACRSNSSSAVTRASRKNCSLLCRRKPIWHDEHISTMMLPRRRGKC